jgi:hypothetical protein
LGEACWTGFSSEKYSQRQISQAYLKQAKLNLVITKIQSTTFTARYPKSTKPPERQLDADGPIGPGRAAALPNASVDTPSSPPRDPSPRSPYSCLASHSNHRPKISSAPVQGSTHPTTKGRRGTRGLGRGELSPGGVAVAGLLRRSGRRASCTGWDRRSLRGGGVDTERTGSQAVFFFFPSCKWFGPHSASARAGSRLGISSSELISIAR